MPTDSDDDRFELAARIGFGIMAAGALAGAILGGIEGWPAGGTASGLAAIGGACAGLAIGGIAGVLVVNLLGLDSPPPP